MRFFYAQKDIKQKLKKSFDFAYFSLYHKAGLNQKEKESRTFLWAPPKKVFILHFFYRMTPRQRRMRARRQDTSLFWHMFPVVAFSVGVVIGTVRGTQPLPLTAQEFERTVEYADLAESPSHDQVTVATSVDFLR